MKKILILLVVAALAINGAGCKKKAKPAKQTKMEQLDSQEVAMYRNTALVKELAS
ncbi:MAG: hypothetical protein US13_C0007G0031 [candidate division TM6 bacterium GW2011_GWE2_36_25]|nr:MAG: hypothetical protein US03_C0007G0039 [candidate division TM6 bacterium GW2011_GWF2_36_131]KKQ03021.1 MAG: hypothetical protein US13_C0007G0031 [candidate division TM6 bacterium GW2011_GWE2_36_25]KKQ19577.1 MAG: hypothetical protein US32_C0007G0030 [candidate division TM6 bacterium GW2011_GWA2_36_9]